MQRYLNRNSTSILRVPSRQISIADFFVAPVILERTEKRFAAVDTREIFTKIDNEHTFLSYDQCVEIFNDLAYIVIPFDKTTR